MCALVLTPFTGGPANWSQETGAIETMSVVIWMLCPLAFLLRTGWQDWVRHPHAITLPFLLGAREAPHDVWVVDERLLQPAFYASQGVTVTSVLGGAIAVIVLTSVCTFLIFGLPAAWRALRFGRTWPILLAVAVAFGVAGQVIEEWLMQPMAGVVGTWLPHVAEEASELAFATLVFAAILAPRSTDAPPDARRTHGRSMAAGE